MSELFESEESLSPVEAFRRANRISIFPPSEELGIFVAKHARGEAKGVTEKDAIHAVAKKFNLEGWQKLSWQ